MRAPVPYVPPLAAGQAPAHPPAAGATLPYPPPPGQPYGYPASPYGPNWTGAGGDTMWARNQRARGRIRSTGADFLVAIFAGLTLLSLFLPWYQIRLADSYGDSATFAQTSALGSGAGGWRFAIIASAILLLGYLAARLFFGRYWPPDLPHFPVLLLLAIVNLALVAIAFFQLPEGGVNITSQGMTFGVARAWAAYVGFGAAILAFGASISNRPRMARTA